MRSLLACFALAATGFATAQTTPNPNFEETAAIPVFRRIDPALVHFTTLLREPVDDELDLLLIRAGKPTGGYAPDRGDIRYVGPGDSLGLFLIRRHNPNLLYELWVQRVEEFDAEPKLIRVTEGELVLTFRPEKGYGADNWKFVFDPPSQTLLSFKQYRRFAVEKSVESEGELFLVASNREERLLLRPTASGFAIVPAAVAEPVLADTPDFWFPPRLQETPFGPGDRFRLVRKSQPGWPATPPVIVEDGPEGEREYPLPQAGREGWQRLRPEEAALPYGGGTIQEEIGPAQVSDGRLWFGRTFYNGEGWTGVGGFGYFDPSQRQYVLFEPPEVVDWSTTALLVEQGAVWLGLARRGEWSGEAGGLVRWDRETQTIRKFDFPEVIRTLDRCGDALCIGSIEGAGRLDGARFRRYFVDLDRSGEWTISERTSGHRP